MSRHLAILSNILIVFQVFMLFVCFVDTTSFPEWLQISGKLHPLFLHLPIALVIINLPLYYFLKLNSDNYKLEQLYKSVLVYTALLTTLTAIAGLLLAGGGDYDPDTIFLHKWFGVGTAVLTHAQIYLYSWFEKRTKIGYAIGIAAILILVTGSHYGGTLTHGDGYLSIQTKEVASKFPELSTTTTVFDAAVAPVIATKCLSCHNDTKTKGGLNMSSFASLQKGGKNGAIFTAGDPDASMMIERMLLDMEDKKHMPPKGKFQLTENEILLFTKWIENGASPSKTYHALEATDTLKLLVDKIRNVQNTAKAEKVYPFQAASQSKIDELNTPYRRILPLAYQSPALSVKFFLKEKFSINMLEECKSINTQVVEINLSNMPVDDKVFPILSQFEHLEKLNLNGTSIAGKSLNELLKNKNLQQLSLASTVVDLTTLDGLAKSAVKTVYLWNTKVTEQDLVSLKKKMPSIAWDLGYIPDKNELLKLTPPKPINTDRMILGKDEKIILKHPLPEVQIKYTLDGSKPDSLSGNIYQTPILASKITRVIAVATNKGWISSDASDYTFFQEGQKVDSVQLLNLPSEKYRKNGKLLLIDLKKGFPEILNLNWLGYKENSFKTGFYFSNNQEKSQVVVSAADNTGAYVFPPTKIIVRGGDQPNKLKTIGTLSPEMPKGYRSNGVLPYIVPIQKGNYKYIEIEAFNIQSLPSWHGGKGEKGWVFVDEVFFY